KSEESTEALTKKLEDLGLSVDAYMAGVECEPSAAQKAIGAPNGLLPSDSLCELHVEGHYPRADAAVDFLRMNQAYAQEFGTDMCVTSSYRDLQDQHRVYAQQPPGYAAVPGTSNHGLGLAVDLCGGVQNQGAPQFNWLEAHAGEYNWFHPARAYSNPFEPWHWEDDPTWQDMPRHGDGGPATAGCRHRVPPDQPRADGTSSRGDAGQQTATASSADRNRQPVGSVPGERLRLLVGDREHDESPQAVRGIVFGDHGDHRPVPHNPAGRVRSGVVDHQRVASSGKHVDTAAWTQQRGRPGVGKAHGSRHQVGAVPGGGRIRQPHLGEDLPGTHR